MPYEVPVETAEKVAQNIAEIISKDENVKDSEYVGVNELADSSINYLIILHCKIESRFQVKRDALKTILQEFERNNISVPYNQIDVHNK